MDYLLKTEDLELFESLKHIDLDLTNTVLLESCHGSANGFYGKNHTEESKTKIGNSNKGKNHYPKGKPRSDETKLKMSLATKGKKSFVMTDEQKEKLSLANVGKNKTEETKKKIAESISKAQQGKKRGPYKRNNK